MSGAPTPPGDKARATVSVDVPVAEAFRIFTEELDLWWGRGVRFRAASKFPSSLQLEAKPGGRLFETREGEEPIVRGHVLAWEPPSRLLLEWRIENFAADEKTEVEVLFKPHRNGGTMVSVEHRGWAALRPDHPARHGNTGPAMSRMIGLWWGDLLTYLRRHATARSIT